MTNGSTGSFSAADFNTLSDGTGSVAAFTNGQTATFSAGTDASGAYTVSVDTAVSTAGLSFEEGNVTIAPGGGSLTFVSSGGVSVASGLTATVSQAIGGSVGLSTTGPGTLVLSGTNTFTGTVGVNSGTLSISSDTNLGDAANPVSFGGGTLQTTANISTARAVTGSGTAAIASGTTLTSTGSFSTSALTLSDLGTLDLEGGTRTVGALTFTAGGTLNSSAGTVSAAGNITASALPSGATATINPALDLGTAARTVTVASGATLVLQGALTDTSTSHLTKSGAGTLTLNGTNTGLAGGVQLSAGTINVGNKSALGTSQFFFNSGTLNATTDLTGTNALAIGASFGGTTASPSIITATNNIDFAGPSSLFFSTATQTNQITVNNTTTVSGVIAESSTKGASLTIGGIGTLNLSNTNTFSEPVIVGTSGGSVTVLANGAATSSGSSPPAPTGSSTGTGDVTVVRGNRLGGGGAISGMVTLAVGTGSPNTGGIIAPGSTGTGPAHTTSTASIGTLTTGNETFNGGATYELEVNPNSDGTIGSNDFISLGALTLTATSMNPFDISLLRVGSNQSTPITSPILITHETNTLIGTGTGQFANEAALAAAFSVMDNGPVPQGFAVSEESATDLGLSGGGYYLVVESTPELGSAMLFGSAAGGLLLMRRRRRTQAGQSWFSAITDALARGSDAVLDHAGLDDARLPAPASA